MEITPIPSMRRVFYDTKANLDALTGLADEDLGFATDTTLLYRQDGAGAANWVAITSASALNLFVKTETRVLTAATGDVAYTGYGFQPDYLIIFGKITSGMLSWGTLGVSAFEIGLRSNYTGSTFYYLDNILTFKTASGDQQYASVKSLDADGFTLTWTKSGTPTQTANLSVWAFKL